MLRICLAAAGILVITACATPTLTATSQAARTSSAETGDVLSAAPGEAVYTETTSRFIWSLSVPQDAVIGPYTVEAGDYPLQGLSREGYFFGVGDDCAGEPAVTAARFADAPEYLRVEAADVRTCVIPVLDHARCGPAVGAMRYEREPGEAEQVTTLIYDGPGLALDGVTRLARFTLVTETALDRQEETITAVTPGLVVAANGRFRLVRADEAGVQLIVEQAINEVPAIEPHSLAAAPSNW